MSGSAWDGLYDFMVRVAPMVDLLRLVMLWSGLFALLGWLILSFFKPVFQMGGEDSEVSLVASGRASFKDRLEEMANIAISRRPRRRKHRHHHPKPASSKSSA